MFDLALEEIIAGNDLTLTKSGEPTSRDLLIATAAVLFGVIPVDTLADSRELIKFGDILKTEFQISSDEDIGYILELVKQLSGSEEAQNRFFSLLLDNFSVGQRQYLLSKTWKIIIADSNVDQNEGEYSIKIRKKLNLSLEQAAFAVSQVSRGEI